MRRTSSLLALLTACTPFFDTDVDHADVVDTGTDTSADAAGDSADDSSGLLGACCVNDSCQLVVEAACTLLRGAYSAGLSCAESGCIPTCASYCSEFADACGSVSDDYAGLADCASFCSRDAEWDPGTFDDKTSNTIGCRTYHAGVANQPGEDRELHCGHAGIGGEDVCGSWCVNYCHLAIHICDEEPIFDGLEPCLEACRDMPDDGQFGDTTGDTVQCRMYHLTAAARAPRQAGEHCGHAAPVSLNDTCTGPPPG